MPDVNMELIGVKLPPDMRDQIEALAKSDHDRPLSAMVRILLQEALSARAKKAKRQ